MELTVLVEESNPSIETKMKNKSIYVCIRPEIEYQTINDESRLYCIFYMKNGKILWN